MLKGLAVLPGILDSVSRTLIVCVNPLVTGTSDGLLVSVGICTYIQLNQFLYYIGSLALFVCLKW